MVDTVRDLLATIEQTGTEGDTDVSAVVDRITAVLDGKDGPEPVAEPVADLLPEHCRRARGSRPPWRSPRSPPRRSPPSTRSPPHRRTVADVLDPRRRRPARHPDASGR